MKKIFLIAILVTLLLVAGCSSGNTEAKKEFAKCLSAKDVTMFGAYWCPHCIDQKKDFGKAFNEINYVECSLPGGKGQTEICTQAGIKSYPTWEFAPGDRINGGMSLEQLSLKTGCQLNI